MVRSYACNIWNLQLCQLPVFSILYVYTRDSTNNKNSWLKRSIWFNEYNGKSQGTDHYLYRGRYGREHFDLPQWRQRSGIAWSIFRRRRITGNKAGSYTGHDDQFVGRMADNIVDKSLDSNLGTEGMAVMGISE